MVGIPVETPAANPAAFTAMRVAIGVALSNAAATLAPTVNDDSSQGYSVGSYWRRASTGREWLCVSAAVGAAVWQQNTGGCKIPSGSAILASNVGSVNATGISTTPLRTYSPVDIGGLGTFSWEVFMTTPQATGEFRVAVYDSDENGLPGLRVVAPVVVSLAVGTNAIINAALAWTPPKIGRFWIMQQVKAIATQVVIPRIGAGLPGVIPATPAIITTANAVNLVRYLTSPEAYGSDPTDATGLTSGSIGSDCPVGWLKAA